MFSFRQRIVLTVVGVAVSLAACSKTTSKPPPPPPRDVNVVTLAPSQVRDTSDYLGRLESRGSVEVLPQAVGYVRAIHIRPGDRVEKGALLVEIDNRAQAAAVASASAQVQSAKVAVNRAQEALTRATTLRDQQLSSADDLEQKQAALAAAQAMQRAASAQMSQQRVALGFHEVRAAVPGTIGDVTVRIGDYVNATSRLTSIAATEDLELTIGVPAERVRGMKPGAIVEILDGNGQPLLDSTVFYVAPEADAKTQLVELKATFHNTIGLRASELVRVRLVYAIVDALEVPAGAVVRQSGQAFVFQVSEKDGASVVERRPVTLGPLGAANYVLEDGLPVGARVAVSAIQYLRDGAKVNVVAAPPTSTTAAPSTTGTR